MNKNTLRNSVHQVILLMLLGLIMSGCSTRSEKVPQLRIMNNGSIPINDLVVLLPEESIDFGDIAAGATTEYKDVPQGVYSYAAYQFEVEGEVMTQPVIDWVGESPMEGTLFTYVIDFDPERANTGDTIRLIEVKNDD